jgi:hypothetical protein
MKSRPRLTSVRAHPIGVTCAGSFRRILAIVDVALPGRQNQHLAFPRRLISRAR